jgi:hypothetical protein
MPPSGRVVSIDSGIVPGGGAASGEIVGFRPMVDPTFA